MDAIRNAYLEQLQNKLSNIAHSTKPWINNADQENANFLLKKVILALPDNIVTKIDDREYSSIKTFIVDKVLMFSLTENTKSTDFNVHFSNFIEILLSDIYSTNPQLLGSDSNAH